MSPPTHTPLNHTKSEFRLVTFTTTKDGAIRAHLHIFPLSQCPSYIALSYTWGFSPPRRTIYIDSQKTRIRENIYQALKSILRLRNQLTPNPKGKSGPLEENKLSLKGMERKAAECEFFWIDSICINQRSLGERNHQVGLMGQIFEGAEFVIAWLGSEMEGSKDIIRAIEEYKVDPKPVPISFSQIPMPRDLRNKLEVFGNLEYWSRLWIVQEIILAKDILVGWGDEWLPWWRIVNVGIDSSAGKMPISITTPEHAVQLTNDFDENWVKIIKEKQRRELFLKEPEKFSGKWSMKPVNLYSLVMQFAHHGCGEPRDKVIGLLGLLPDDDARAFADYGVGIGEFFEEVCRYTFRTAPINGENTRGRFQGVLGMALGLTYGEYSMTIRDV